MSDSNEVNNSLMGMSHTCTQNLWDLTSSKENPQLASQNAKQ